MESKYSVYTYFGSWNDKKQSFHSIEEAIEGYIKDNCLDKISKSAIHEKTTVLILPLDDFIPCIDGEIITSDVEDQIETKLIHNADNEKICKLSNFLCNENIIKDIENLILHYYDTFFKENGNITAFSLRDSARYYIQPFLENGDIIQAI